MAKIPTLSDLTSLTNETSAIGTINTNNTSIETAFANTLSRDGSTPNSMEADLDMDGFRILNHAAPVNPTDLATLGSITDSLEAAELAAQQAAADAAQVAIDRLAVAADRSSTALDVAATEANVLLTNADVVSTGNDVTATNADVITTNANAAAAQAAALQAASSFSSTSTTSVAIGVGSKVFTTQANKNYIQGQFISVASAADGANYMHGQVDTYTGTSLTINVTDTGGSGTHADWNIAISGSKGVDGVGSGSVTSVSVTTSNGVSGSVADPTSTPAITLTLGNITPTSVTATNNVTGANLSGTNTGDQTITLTGDVTGSGTGSFAATIAADAVDADKIDGADAANIRALLEVATKSQTDFISGMIKTPAAQDYRIIVKAPIGGTITETVTRAASGTCTATFKVNTTALGGTANSVSSSEQAQAHASSNTFAADDDIVITISSVSSCADMSFTIKFTRTLA